MLPSTQYWKLCFGMNLGVNGIVGTKLFNIKLFILNAQNQEEEITTGFTIAGDPSVTNPQNAFDGDNATYTHIPNFDWTSGIKITFDTPQSLAKIEIDNSINGDDVSTPGSVEMKFSVDGGTTWQNFGYKYITMAMYNQFETELGVRRKFFYTNMLKFALSEPAGTYDAVQLFVTRTTEPGTVLGGSLNWYQFYVSINNPDISTGQVAASFPWPVAQQTGTFDIYVGYLNSFSQYVTGLQETFTVTNMQYRTFGKAAKFWRFQFPNRGIGASFDGQYVLHLYNIQTEAMLSGTKIGQVKPINVTATGLSDPDHLTDPSFATWATIPMDPALTTEVIFEYAEPVNLTSIIIDNRQSAEYYKTPTAMLVECADESTGPWKFSGHYSFDYSKWNSGNGEPYIRGYLRAVIMPAIKNGFSGVYDTPQQPYCYVSHDGVFSAGETYSQWRLVATNDKSIPTVDSPAYNLAYEALTTQELKLLTVHIASNLPGVTKELYYIITATVTQYLLKNGSIVNVGNEALPGELLVSTDQTALYFGDEFGGLEQASPIHIGDTQPLSNKKVWIDKANMEIKYNTGSAWESKTAQAAPTDCKGFIDVVTMTPVGGTFAYKQKITLVSDQSYPIYYTLDGSEPTIASNLYTVPLAMFTGTLRAKSIIPTASSIEISAAFIEKPAVVMTANYIDAIPATVDFAEAEVVFDPEYVNEPLRFFMDTTNFLDPANFDSFVDPANGNDWFTLTPNVPHAPANDGTWSLGNVLYCALVNAAGVLVESLEIPLYPINTTLTVDVGVVQGDAVVVTLDPPVVGNYWGIYAKYNGTVGLGNKIVSIPNGTASWDISSLVHPGDYEFQAIFYRGNRDEPAKTQVLSNKVIATVPGTYVIPAPAQLWQGLGLKFVKVPGEAPTLVQDKILSDVIFTRRTQGQGLYNIAKQTQYDSTAPINTKWAFMGIGPNSGASDPTVFNTRNKDSLIFDTWVNSSSASPPDMVGTPGVVWLVDKDIYFDVMFEYWEVDTVAGGGGFTYRRSTPVSHAVTGPQIWRGVGKTFMTSDGGTGYTLHTDRLSQGVNLRAMPSGGWINDMAEGSYVAATSPAGTSWAFLGLNGNPTEVALIKADNYASLNFNNFGDNWTTSEDELVGVPAVVHLVADNIYLEVTLTAWDSVNGGFALTRSTAISTPAAPQTQAWYGTQGAVTYTQVDGADPSISPDVVTTNAVLAAALAGGITNLGSDTLKWAFRNLGPNDTWGPASFGIDNISQAVFSDWFTATNGTQPIDTGLLWIVEENIFMEVSFQAWNGVSGVTYIRSTATSVYAD